MGVQAHRLASGLTPLALLVYGLYLDLGVNPVETVTNTANIWTLRLIMLTLAITPLRWLTGINQLINYRRLIGLFAFFYGSLHFDVFLSRSPVRLRGDVGGRPVASVHHGGLHRICPDDPLALTSTTGWIRRLGGQLEPAPQADLHHGHGRRSPLLLESQHQAAADQSEELRHSGGGAAGVPGLATLCAETGFLGMGSNVNMWTSCVLLRRRHFRRLRICVHLVPQTYGRAFRRGNTVSRAGSENASGPFFLVQFFRGNV